MSDNMCPICLGIIRSPAMTDQCRHQFCFLYIERWSQNHHQCSVCRQPFPHIRQQLHRQPTDRQQIQRQPTNSQQIQRQPTNRQEIHRQPTNRQFHKQHADRQQIQRQLTNRQQIHRRATDRQQIHRHPQSTEAINNFNTNTIINGGNIRIGRMYNQSFFFGYDLESDQQ